MFTPALPPGTVNCYLLETGFAFILIDTGCSSQRATMEQALRDAGCSPGDLKLILLTHGDFDHTGNAAHLRQVFSAPVGMHPDDTRMLAEGDMFANRKSNNWLVRKLGSVMFQFGKAEQFEPDLQLVDDDELIDYGLNAHVISLPGHSCGSIGILMESGEFFFAAICLRMTSVQC